MKCAHCNFYQCIDADKGECRESPPRAFPVPVRTLEGQGIGFHTVFPIVESAGWCGAFDDNEVPEKPLALGSN